MRLRNILLCVCGLLGSLSASSQDVYNSVYSIYGIGFLSSPGSALNRGLSGTGIGIQDEYVLNHANPASLNSISQPANQMFEMSVHAGTATHASASNSDSKSSGGMGMLSYWFRLKSKYATAISLSPNSNISYNILTTRNAGALSDAAYQYKGQGGTAQLTWGNAYNITKNLSVGFNGLYVFGNVSRTEKMQISQNSFLQYDTKTYASRLGFGGGIQYRIPIGKTAVILGAVAQKAMTLKGTRQGTFMFGNTTVFAQTDIQNITYRMPDSYGAGIAFRTNRSTLAFDATYKEWPLTADSDPGILFKNTWRFSGGYTLRGDITSVNYLNTISFRAGGYVEDFYVLVNNTNMKSVGWSVGVSLPMQNVRSAISLTYGNTVLGTTSNGLIQETCHRITMDIQVSDLWGVRRRFD